MPESVEGPLEHRYKSAHVERTRNFEDKNKFRGMDQHITSPIYNAIESPLVKDISNIIKKGNSLLTNISNIKRAKLNPRPNIAAAQKRRMKFDNKENELLKVRKGPDK